MGIAFGSGSITFTGVTVAASGLAVATSLFAKKNKNTQQYAMNYACRGSSSKDPDDDGEKKRKSNTMHKSEFFRSEEVRKIIDILVVTHTGV